MANAPKTVLSKTQAPPLSCVLLDESFLIHIGSQRVSHKWLGCPLTKGGHPNVDVELDLQDASRTVW